MFSAVVLSAVLAGAAQALMINTPTAVTQCQPTMLTFGEGTAPYYISIIPGNQPSAAALQTFPTTSQTSLTWNVALAAGTSVTVKIVDSTGETNYSDAVTVQAGSDTTCSASSAASSDDEDSSAASSSTPAAAAVTTDAMAVPTKAGGASHKATDASSSATSAASSAKSAAKSASSSAASGIGAAAASASSNTSGATALKAGTSLLAAAALFALVA